MHDFFRDRIPYEAEFLCVSMGARSAPTALVMSVFCGWVGALQPG